MLLVVIPKLIIRLAIAANQIVLLVIMDLAAMEVISLKIK